MARRVLSGLRLLVLGGAIRRALLLAHQAILGSLTSLAALNGSRQSAAPGRAVRAVCCLDRFRNILLATGSTLFAFLRRLASDLSPEDPNAQHHDKLPPSVTVDLGPHLRNPVLGRADRLPKLQDPQRGGIAPCRTVFPLFSDFGRMDIRPLAPRLCYLDTRRHDLHLRREQDGRRRHQAVERRFPVDRPVVRIAVFASSARVYRHSLSGGADRMGGRGEISGGSEDSLGAFGRGSACRHIRSGLCRGGLSGVRKPPLPRTVAGMSVLRQRLTSKPAPVSQELVEEQASG